ncbi:MAG: SAM-dependent methyltransferase, partial [Bacilli bacterium]|nr:SAM-dependent methyltransferase [Bacilli bacterium]
MFKFLRQYVMHPRSVGAIAPSGKNLALKMMEPIDFNNAKVIVEYGPGTGSFTKELIRLKKESTTLILIEQNKSFVEILKKEYKDIKNLYIVNDSAENVVKILKEYKFKNADYIVSGLPFTSLPKEISIKIFNETNRALDKGQFITFQYSKVKKRFFEEYFNFSDILYIFKNLPPAYV